MRYEIGAVAIMVLAAAAALWEPHWWPWGPELIHDPDGRPWYRHAGTDAHQRAIETCHGLDGREIRYGNLADDPVVFCCAQRGRESCDVPGA